MVLSIFKKLIIESLILKDVKKQRLKDLGIPTGMPSKRNEKKGKDATKDKKGKEKKSKKKMKKECLK